MNYLLTHKLYILLIVGICLSLKGYAQLGEVEGDFRVSDIRPTIELFDNDSANNRVEGMIKNLGDDVYINSFAGDLFLGSRDDGQTTLVSDVVISNNGNGALVGINEPNPIYPLVVKVSSNSASEARMSGGSLLFYQNGINKASFSRNANGPLLINSSHQPMSDNESTFIMRSTKIDAINQVVMKIAGNNNIGIGNFGSGYPTSKVHLRHRLSNADPRHDGLKIQNDGGNKYYVTAYVVNASNDLELYSGQSANPIGRFDAISGAYSALSDANVKENIQPLGAALDKINTLNPVSYHFKHDSIQDKRSFGLLAQELSEVIPELVEKSQKRDVNLVDYSGLFPWLIKAVQELSEQNNTQTEYIERLEQKIDQLEEYISIEEN